MPESKGWLGTTALWSLFVYVFRNQSVSWEWPRMNEGVKVFHNDTFFNMPFYEMKNIPDACRPKTISTKP